MAHPYHHHDADIQHRIRNPPMDPNLLASNLPEPRPAEEDRKNVIHSPRMRSENLRNPFVHRSRLDKIFLNTAETSGGCSVPRSASGRVVPGARPWLPIRRVFENVQCLRDG